jgi:sugar/nucleoside kinase (ribokinase family)
MGALRRDLDVVVFGEINPDLIVRAADPRPVFGQAERLVETVDLVVGSSSVIFAMGAARLGLNVAFAGLVGDDALGRFMVEAMVSAGLDTSAVRVHPTVSTGASVVLSGPSDRAILTAPGAIPLARVRDLPAGLPGRARHVHVGSPFLLEAARPDLAALFVAARAAGTTTSIDPGWDPRGQWNGELAAILAETDIFMPNAAEAVAITGLADTADAARKLATMGPRVVAVKQGADGALAATAAGEFVVSAAPPVTARDTTGAGDSFDAGFVAGWLAGRSVRDCLALGVVCGALSTRGVGGTAAQPTMDQALEVLERWRG